MNNVCFLKGGEEKKKRNAVLNFPAVMQQNGTETIIQMKDPPPEVAAHRGHRCHRSLCGRSGSAVGELIRLVAPMTGRGTFGELDILREASFVCVNYFCVIIRSCIFEY